MSFNLHPDMRHVQKNMQNRKTLVVLTTLPTRWRLFNWVSSFGHASVAQAVECWALHLVGGVVTTTRVWGLNPEEVFPIWTWNKFVVMYRLISTKINDLLADWLNLCEWSHCLLTGRPTDWLIHWLIGRLVLLIRSFVDCTWLVGLLVDLSRV